jgi:serine/threonine protein kinase
MTLEQDALLNNRYRIVDILGLGGMGSVYKAVDENLGMDVAVKENLFTTDEFARQFRREAVILASLRHPNLPRVTDHFVIEGQGQYLVMDYIDGEDLRQRMDRQGVLPDEEVITIGIAICDALSYLGLLDPPIVHRDIKPGNVRITPEGKIYLVDFGLAKKWNNTEKTATGARAMTPGYSPPEQYGTAQTDHRSDIYSLGATLYAAITTYIPEDAMNRAMGQDHLTPIADTNPEVSQRLANTIEKALEVRPGDRYQTAKEFKQALLNINTTVGRDTGEYRVSPAPENAYDASTSESVPISSRIFKGGSGEAYDLDRPHAPAGSSGTPMADHGRARIPERISWQKYWWLYLLLAVFLITVIVIITSRTDLPEQALAMVTSPTPTQTMPDPTQIGTPDTQKQITTLVAAVGVTETPEHISEPTFTRTATIIPTETPTLTPTATHTATSSPTPTFLGGGSGQIAFASDRRGMPQLFVADIDSGDWYQVTDMPEGACQPEWSPDGRYLIFISPCEGNEEEYPGAAMFLIEVDNRSSSPIPLPTVPGGDYDPAWSPDGKSIIFTSHRTTRRPRVYKMVLEDQSVTLLSERYARDKHPAWSSDGQSIAFVTAPKGVKEIWVMGADGENRQQFSKTTDASNLYPDWSPNGDVILFTQYDFSGRVPGLTAGYYSEGDYTEFDIRIGPVPMREAHYSPDGLWLVFEGWPEGGNHEIYIMTTNGAALAQITNHPAADFDPVWRPPLLGSTP